MSDTTPDAVPDAVLAGYGLRGATLVPITSGWINLTLRVERGDERSILQRLHPVFSGAVNLDIHALTPHLDAAGVCTPHLIPAVDGRLFVEVGRPWRMLTFLEGETLETLSPARAHSAGRLVGRFQRALGEVQHVFSFTRPGAHDTAKHIASLARVMHDPVPEAIDRDELGVLVRDILRYPLPPMGPAEQRIVHGDLKATNLLFDGDEATAVLDLDTLAHGDLAVDLGDALRSWCNLAGESSDDASFDRETFEAAMSGYLESTSGWLTRPEVARAIGAAETIAVELAARFATDVFEDHYFGFDGSRYPSRRAHNLQRARAQLKLARSIAAQAPDFRSWVAAG